MKPERLPEPVCAAETVGTVDAPVAGDPLDDRRRVRLRRLNAALDRLGILDAIGRDWLTVDSGTGRVHFDDLTEGRYLAFQLLLDDLADGVGRPTGAAVSARRNVLRVTAPVRPPLIAHQGGTGPHIGGRR